MLICRERDRTTDRYPTLSQFTTSTVRLISCRNLETRQRPPPTRPHSVGSRKNRSLMPPPPPEKGRGPRPSRLVHLAVVLSNARCRGDLLARTGPREEEGAEPGRGSPRTHGTACVCMCTHSSRVSCTLHGLALARNHLVAPEALEFNYPPFSPSACTGEGGPGHASE